MKNPEQPAMITADTLRTSSYQPVLPFEIKLGDGRILLLRRILRNLPGKRLVGEGEIDNRSVLAKLFVANSSTRHFRREHSGIEALQNAGIPTPALVAALPLEGSGYAVLTEFVADAKNLANVWLENAGNPPNHEMINNLLGPVVLILARMHLAGLAQADLHLGNFLRAGDHLFVIDGDAIHTSKKSHALSPMDATRNLAILLAQLPPTCDSLWAPLLTVSLNCSECRRA
jgi:hypothetical protein